MLVIDPYHFALDAGQKKFSEKRISDLKISLKKLNKICVALNERICYDKDAWREVELKYIRPLLKDTDDQELQIALEVVKDHLDLKKFSEPINGRTWGVWGLCNNLLTPEDKVHADNVARAAVFCLKKNVPVYIFVREKEARNINIHSVDNTFLIERLRWRIYVSEKGLAGAISVPCITDLLNIQKPWTARYDIGLPSSGTYAFIPKQDWHLKETVVFRVAESKYVYIDEWGSAWARPNTPGSPYHWDVYSCDSWQKKSGLTQINICRSDVPGSQGKAGEIHHVPKGKRAAVKK